jgi:DNA-binding transcriptional LysR family regulator
MRTRRRALTELDVFLAIARQGGLRPAATTLGVSVSSVSDRLRELEVGIGARLFHRNTRSLALTETGAALLKNLAPAMGAVDAALDSVGRTPSEPAGKLRINAAPPAADLVLGQMLGGFLLRYPFINVDLAVDDGLIDIVAGGFDAGIRYEENLAADMIVRSDRAATALRTCRRSGASRALAHRSDGSVHLQSRADRGRRRNGRRRRLAHF